MIVIPNYGCGNLASIVRMLQYCDAKAKIAEHPDELLSASKIIIAGVGAFDYGINTLRERGWEDNLNIMALEKKIPVLGICLGMQLMFTSSEEGIQQGLGWFNVGVKKFSLPQGSTLKVPHMGWNTVNTVERNSDLFKSELETQKFYFVHSFHIDSTLDHNVAATTHYGYDFPSAVQRDNIYGVQFHPEKSHKYGMNLLSNFSKK